MYYSNVPWYLTMLHIRQISITRIGCNRTLTIARITRQESHQELMISLVLCTIPYSVRRVAEAGSSFCWPCKEATPWRILLREQLNICRMLEYLFLFLAAQTAKIAPDYCSNAVVTSAILNVLLSVSRYRSCADLDCLLEHARTKQDAGYSLM